MCGHSRKSRGSWSIPRHVTPFSSRGEEHLREDEETEKKVFVVPGLKLWDGSNVDREGDRKQDPSSRASQPLNETRLCPSQMMRSHCISRLCSWQDGTKMH